MNVIIKDIYGVEEKVDIGTAIEMNLKKEYQKATGNWTSDSIGELYDDVEKLRTILCNILKELPLEQINKILGTSFEKWLTY